MCRGLSQSSDGTIGILWGLSKWVVVRDVRHFWSHWIDLCGQRTRIAECLSLWNGTVLCVCFDLLRGHEYHTGYVLGDCGHGGCTSWWVGRRVLVDGAGSVLYPSGTTVSSPQYSLIIIIVIIPWKFHGEIGIHFRLYLLVVRNWIACNFNICVGRVEIDLVESVCFLCDGRGLIHSPDEFCTKATRRRYLGRHCRDESYWYWDHAHQRTANNVDMVQGDSRLAIVSTRSKDEVHDWIECRFWSDILVLNILRERHRCSKRIGQWYVCWFTDRMDIMCGCCE